jgi:hypothetical protein
MNIICDEISKTKAKLQHKLLEKNKNIDTALTISASKQPDLRLKSSLNFMQSRISA